MSTPAPMLPLLEWPRWAVAFTRDRVRASAAAAREHGDVVRLPTPGRRVYLATHPRDVGRILVGHGSRYKKSFDFALMAELLGDGLITSEGDDWRTARRIIQPLFHRGALERFVPVMQERAAALADRWAAADRPVSLTRSMTQVTQEIIAEHLFAGVSVEESSEIAEILEQGQAFLIRRALAPMDLARWLPTPGRIRFRRGIARLDALMARYIEERRGRDEQGGDLTSRLLAARDPETGQGLSDRAVRDQVLTMFVAGHETTAVGLTWTLLCLAEHPAIEERVVEEVRAQGTGDPRALPYTRQVLEESLRLHPPVPLFGREALEDDELGGHPVPAGSTVALSPWVTQRRADLWPDPEAFRPARFGPDADPDRPRFAYFPFGGGMRQCIGKRFALWEMAIVLGTLLARFRVRPLDEGPVRAVPLMTYRPAGDVPVRLDPR